MLKDEESFLVRLTSSLLLFAVGAGPVWEPIHVFLFGEKIHQHSSCVFHQFHNTDEKLNGFSV